MTRLGAVGAALGLFGVALTPAAAQSGACAETLQHKVDVAPAGAMVDVPACTYHETVFIGRSITLDGHSVAVIDGDNTRDRWIWIGVSDVTIRGFSMRSANTASQEGAIGTQAGIRNVTIDHNDLGPTVNGEQVGIGQTTDSRVINNDIHGGGQMGIGTFRNVRLLVQHNHIHGNNTAGVDPFWAAGGMKAVAETDSQFLDNEVDHNAGPGIWCDIACDHVTIAGNVIHDQLFNPIFYEISSHGEITGNSVTSSSGIDVWGCIVVSSSGSTVVHGNTCTDSKPLRAQLDARSDLPRDAGTGVRLENNSLVRPTPSQATSWWQADPNGPLVPGTNGNVDIGNVVLQSLSTATPVPTAIACRVSVELAGTPGPYRPC